MKSRFLLCWLILSLIATSCVWAQESPEESYRRAFQVFDNAGGEDEAVAIWLALADSHPGDIWGARSLLTAAQWVSDYDYSLALFNRYVSEYAGTEFEVSGRLGLIHHQHYPNEEAELAALESLLTELGAPDPSQIAENPVQARKDVWALDESTQKDAYQVLRIIVEIRLRPNGQLTEDSRVNALPLASFIYSTFGPSGIADGTDRVTLKTCFGVPVFAVNESEAPGLTILEPSDGAAVSSMPVIRARATTRTANVAQLDLTSLRVELDGSDATPFAEITVTYSADPSGPFETIDIRLTLIEALAPGTHVFTAGVQAQAPDGGEGPTSEEGISFTVLSNETETVLLPAKDTILSLRNQHENDGANNLLTLEKIQGKATRTAVAFDLANTNLDGLSQATLVLSVGASEGVNGWGNGRTISAQAITTPWLEGNGMNFGLKKKDQDPGNGSGTTWFSPIDEDISNDSSNSAVNWNGAGLATNPPTAPAVTMSNGLSGEVAFDVTADVLNGADNGWLILKDQENVGSKISFYSREGAAAAGDPDLAPRLILEFGEVASSGPTSDSLLAHVGFGAISTKLRLTSNGSEVRSTKEILQENPMAALAAEQLLSEATRTNPVLNLTTRVAYRSWLADGVQIAAAPFWAA